MVLWMWNEPSLLKRTELRFNIFPLQTTQENVNHWLSLNGKGLGWGEEKLKSPDKSQHCNGSREDLSHTGASWFMGRRWTSEWLMTELASDIFCSVCLPHCPSSQLKMIFLFLCLHWFTITLSMTFLQKQVSFLSLHWFTIAVSMTFLQTQVSFLCLHWFTISPISMTFKCR